MADETESNGELDKGLVVEILDDLDMNLSKVREHGGRADRIVEGMLAHSRDEPGGEETMNVNRVVDEYAKLAYHGLRGTDSAFNVTMVREFDENAGQVTGIARDLSRVFLNIVTNACHATAARREEADASYSPTVTLKTKGHQDHVVVSVRDNGTGIPDSIVRKIFEPFFTTKSGTQGTGLGLSISRDIVVGHGGELEVESEPGEFTEFRIKLLRESNIAEVTSAS
ncbi:sensor histidine kinase [Candidatus Palauibacter sp.]|uniref:sensor histidine kinase n=1 Tax=Candidatus Palauibacter sp. TaxID=3101350 RepID=UPI003B59ACAA